MVRTEKMVLKKVIGRSNLNYDELFTILTEVESIYFTALIRVRQF